jgi:3-keto-disaccharide hydrolase
MSTTEFRDSSRSHWLFQRRARRQEISIVLVGLALVLGTLLCGCCTAPRDESQVAERSEETEAATTVESQDAGEEEAIVAEKSEEEDVWDFRPGKEVSLFDGETLGLWRVTDFGGQGDVHVKDGAIYMEMGSYTTGVTWSGPVVRMNYEIMLEAMRVDGTDFFCALTFPVGKDPCTLVLGGWGGTLCGLSNIGFYDASENETTTFHSFENKTWYHVRLRVLPDRIQAWVDGEDLIDVETTGKRIDIRPEMDLCQPLGIATWVTTGAVRNIFLTKLPDVIE